MNALKKTLLAAVVATVVAPSVANANTFGRLENVSCDVVIQRGGELLKAVEGSAVMPGDRVVTYDGSSANIIFTPTVGQTCTGSIGELSSVSITNSCSALNAVSGISDADRSLGLSSCGGAYIPSASSGDANLLYLLGGAAALGLLVAAIDDDDEGAPASP